MMGDIFQYFDGCEMFITSSWWSIYKNKKKIGALLHKMSQSESKIHANNAIQDSLPKFFQYSKFNTELLERT
jgi:hypothetical protein